MKIFNQEAQLVKKIPTAEGEKVAVTRWPTDQEWAERSRSRRIFMRNGAVERMESEEGDLILFDLIKLPDSAQLDEYEASEVIEQLARAEVLDVSLQPGKAEVTLRVVAGLETRHTLKLPSIKAKKAAQQQAAKVRELQYGRRCLVISIEPIAELYDKLFEKAEGYDDPVPVIHKDAVVRAVFDAIDSAIAGDSEGF